MQVTHTENGSYNADKHIPRKEQGDGHTRQGRDLKQQLWNSNLFDMYANNATWADISGTMYSRKLNPDFCNINGHTTTQNSNISATSSMLTST